MLLDKSSTGSFDYHIFQLQETFNYYCGEIFNLHELATGSENCPDDVNKQISELMEKGSEYRKKIKELQDAYNSNELFVIFPYNVENPIVLKIGDKVSTETYPELTVKNFVGKMISFKEIDELLSESMIVDKLNDL